MFSHEFIVSIAHIYARQFSIWIVVSLLDSSKNCLPIKDAISQWPPLEHYAKSGKIDLGDPNALREYNRAILHWLTGYLIEMPKGNLIPAICLRNTYIHYLRDRFPNADVLVDIGTGASAILALLAFHHGFNVIATELDPVSLAHAKRNIELNHVSVRLFQSHGGIFTDVIPRPLIETIDICVTYPPFYPTDKPGRTSVKKRGFKGTGSELFGGETGIEFTVRYIGEAIALNIPIATVLLHKKEFADVAHAEMEKHYDAETIPIKAGNRIRYLVLGIS